MKRHFVPWRRAAIGGITLWMLVTAPLGRPGADGQSKKHRNSVAYRNVTMEFDGALSKEYLAETVAAVPLENPTDKPEGVAPEHIVITLRDSYASRLRREASSAYALPRVFVFPTSDPADPGFDLEFPTIRRAVRDLEKLLGRRGGAVMQSIPFLPWGDERQLLIARKRPIRFRNGRGILFLTQYDQEESPINNSFLVYTFQGLTDDNAWYVSAVFPVSAQGLPASGEVDNRTAFRAAYGTYVRTMTEKLNRLPVKRFTPGLVLLEEMIRSLKVGPRTGRQ